jgi:hypothetical protein
VARLIALVWLRWRLALRAISARGERVLGLVLMVPGLLLFSGFGATAAFFGARALGQTQPQAVLPALSALATGLGLFWTLSPLLTGVAFSESHDLTRLLHFPIPVPTLVTASLLANLAQPAVLAALPIAFCLALALARNPLALPLVLPGVVLSLLTTVAVAQAAGLVLHGLSRHRRLHDIALSLAVVPGLLLSVAPLLLLTHGAAVGRVAQVAIATDVCALSPFAWGVRAAVHAGRGELAPFAGFALLGLTALAGALAASTALVERIYRGELNLAPGERGVAAARMIFASAIGALFEKDMRSAWRDPALRTALLLGMAGPLFFLFLIYEAQMDLRSGRSLLLLASLVGMGAFGANALGFERRGVALLLGFPIARWRMLVAKNLAAVALRVPNLAMLAIAALLLAPLSVLPAVATVALVTMAVCAGVDNYLSVFFPVTAPAPGGNPYGGAAAGGRGLGAALLTSLTLIGALLLATPFVFLAWLPLMLGRPGLWLVSLPLALGGAAAVYAMLVAGAASLFARREPEILARILGEE